MGKLNCIIQEIYHNLFDTDFITYQAIRDIFVNIHNQLHIFILKTNTNHGHNIINDGRHLIWGIDNIHFARFYLGKIQNIVDNGQQ